MKHREMTWNTCKPHDRPHTFTLSLCVWRDTIIPIQLWPVIGEMSVIITHANFLGPWGSSRVLFRKFEQRTANIFGGAIRPSFHPDFPTYEKK